MILFTATQHGLNQFSIVNFKYRKTKIRKLTLNEMVFKDGIECKWIISKFTIQFQVGV